MARSESRRTEGFNRRRRTRKLRPNPIRGESSDNRGGGKDALRVAKARSCVVARDRSIDIAIGESQDRSGRPASVKILRARKIFQVAAKDETPQSRFEGIPRVHFA